MHESEPSEVAEIGQGFTVFSVKMGTVGVGDVCNTTKVHTLFSLIWIFKSSRVTHYLPLLDHEDVHTGFRGCSDGDPWSGTALQAYCARGLLLITKIIRINMISFYELLDNFFCILSAPYESRQLGVHSGSRGLTPRSASSDPSFRAWVTIKMITGY